MRTIGLLAPLAAAMVLVAGCGKSHNNFDINNFVFTTPTPAPAAAVLDRAGPLCDAAFNREVTGTATAQGPVLELLELEESQIDPSVRDPDLGRWLADPSASITGVPDDEIAASPDAAHALVCVIEHQVQVGTFEITGSPAIRIDYDVRLLSWPDGALVAATSLQGGDPPESRTVSGSCRSSNNDASCHNPVYGPAPSGDLSTWLQQQLGATR